MSSMNYILELDFCIFLNRMPIFLSVVKTFRRKEDLMYPKIVRHRRRNPTAIGLVSIILAFFMITTFGCSKGRDSQDQSLSTLQQLFRKRTQEIRGQYDIPRITAAQFNRDHDIGNLLDHAQSLARVIIGPVQESED